MKRRTSPPALRYERLEQRHAMSATGLIQESLASLQSFGLGGATLDTNGSAQAVAISQDGRYSYIADGTSGLQVVDMGNPTAPIRVAGCSTTNANGVALSSDGRFAFVADHDAGLRVIDVSVPTHPRLVGGFDTPSFAMDVALSPDGRHAFVADNFSGLQVIDISTPTRPVRVGGITTFSAYGVALSPTGSYAFVADNMAGLKVIDVRTPSTPRLVGVFDTSGIALDVAVSRDGKYAYIADQRDGLQIVDVQNVTAPWRVGNYDTPGLAMGVAVSADGGFAVVADWKAGLQVIDTRQPAAPSLIGTLDTAGDAKAAILAPGDRYALLADGTAGLQVAQISTPVNVETARNSLLAGVTAIANPVQPGFAIAYGTSAFSVAMYSGTQKTMIAAASWGNGRVIALPDHQWLEMGRYGNSADTGTFYTNAVTWLAGTASKNTKVVVLDSATRNWLSGRGYTNVIQSSWTALNTDLRGASVFVPGWMGASVSQASLDTIASYARSGGGLLVADYGIGYQWWWGKPIYDAPGNVLLRGAGIGFVGDNRWDSDAVRVQRATGQINSDALLRVFANPAVHSATDKEQAAALLLGMNEALSPSDPLLKPIDQAFRARITTINPTPVTPVKDSFDKALLTREMNLLQNLQPAEVTAHRTANAVYGAVPATAWRLAMQRTVIDANKTGMIATGFYAAAGETVTITVPSALVGKGFQARISGHGDNISGNTDWLRVPFGVQRTFALNAATVKVASAFGGHIYIDLGGQADGRSPGLGRQTITIDGAIAAPIFVLGQTTDQQWIATIRNNPAPYAEFVSDRLAFSVPSSWIRRLDTPTALMRYWDDVVGFQDWVAGAESVRTGPDRINVDVQISHGLLHAGYPIQGPVSYGSRIVDLAGLRAGGDWGWFHELGHEIQRQTSLNWGWYDNPWTFDNDVEVTVNIFANAAHERGVTNASNTGGWDWSAKPDVVMSRAVTEVKKTGAPKFEQKDKYPFYYQLADGTWGWQGYRNVLATYVSDAQNNPANLPKTNQQEKDQWLIRWSRQTGHDMTRYMVGQWGLEVSQQALDTVAAMRLPSWMPLAIKPQSQQVFSAVPRTFDLANAGMSLDGVARLISVGPAMNGSVTRNADNTYTYRSRTGFAGQDRFPVTYESSAGNRQTFTVTLDIAAVRPATPTKAVGTAGDGQVALTWDAPFSNGGAAITDYIVHFSSNNGVTWTTFSDGTSSNRAAKVTGLTNGIDYMFRVAAVNLAGTGVFSSPTAKIRSIRP